MLHKKTTMTPIEKELLISIRRGNQKSFELVFRSYFARLCVFAFRYTRQQETAEDLVKDVFINLWNKHEKLEINSSLSGYLFQAVRNSCINYLQRNKSHRHLSIEELEYLNLKISEPVSNNYTEENILAKELECRILQEINKLPVSCKKIFELSRFEGLSHKKIAEKLEISENTVKVQLYRALKTIRDALSSTAIIFFQLFSKK